MWVIHVKFEKKTCHIQIVHEMLLEGFLVIKLLFKAITCVCNDILS